MMKKILLAGAALILILALVLSGCTKSATPTTPTTPTTPAAPTAPTTPTTPATPTTPTTPTTPGPTFELKFTDKYTSQQYDGQLDDLLAKMITEKTGGRVKITMFHSEALGKEGDFINLMKGDVVDIINLTPGLSPASFELELGLEMPMLGFADRKARLDLTWDLYNKGYFPGLDQFKLVALNATPAMNVFPKKKINTLADLKGMKIRASDATARKFLEMAGASPVAMASSEVYMALDRGILDATYTAYDNFLQMKFYEVIKYAAWDPKVSYGAMFVLMKKDIWNKMPADVQAGVNAAIEAFKPEYLAIRMAQDKQGPAQLIANGVDVYSMNRTEEAKLKELAIPLRAEWIAAKEAKGLPAKKMFDYVDQYLAK